MARLLNYMQLRLNNPNGGATEREKIWGTCTETWQWPQRWRARDRRRESHRDSSAPVSSTLHPSDGPSLLQTSPRLLSAYVSPIYHRCFHASRDLLDTRCQPARLGLQYVSVFWHDMKAGLFALARLRDFAALTLSSLAQRFLLGSGALLNAFIVYCSVWLSIRGGDVLFPKPEKYKHKCTRNIRANKCIGEMRHNSFRGAV